MKICSICRRQWEDEFRVCPIDGISLQEVPSESDPNIGKTFHQCRVVEKIADGELGPIYRVEDRAGGLFALQIVPQGRIASAALLEAFVDAVKIASKLTHPHIVRIHGIETSPDGMSAVLMEYVAGSNLESYRQSQPRMEVSECCRIVQQAAEGLLAGHRSSMLHGALHPTRILIAADGSVKVGGFHRSVVREGVEAYSAAPASLPYLAPEQLGFIRDTAGPDYRTDVYSIGVILYELLTGRQPYDAKSLQELLGKIEGSPLFPPSSINPQVSTTLSRVVLKAISKNPSDRHSSLEQFLRELEAARKPMREPEKPGLAAHQAFIPPLSTDSGLFRTPESPGTPAVRHDSGEGSISRWLRTWSAGKRGTKAHLESRDMADESGIESYPGTKGRRRAVDDFDGRTVVVTGAGRSGPRARGWRDTLTGVRWRSQDLSGTGPLPRRNPFQKAYWIAGGIMLLLVVAFVAWLYLRPSPVPLSVDSSPRGADVVLDGDWVGKTPFTAEIQPGPHTVELQLADHEQTREYIEVQRPGFTKVFYLNPLPSPLPPPPQPEAAVSPVTPGSSPSSPLPFASKLSYALGIRAFFPPERDNAWEILQQWQRAESVPPSVAFVEARERFCRELSVFGNERLREQEFARVRDLLDRARSLAGQPCADSLQKLYDQRMREATETLRAGLDRALGQERYVTPTTDSALKYVRLLLGIDEHDLRAKDLETEIFTRALEQAQTLAHQRQHQAAIEIYSELLRSYPNPPRGSADELKTEMELQKHKLALLGELRSQSTVPVKHTHSLFRFTNRSCSGTLKFDGFSVEFIGEHGFKCSYDGLSLELKKDKILFRSTSIRDGQIELEMADQGAAVKISDVYRKLVALRDKNAQYFK